MSSEMLEMLFSEPLRTIPGNETNPLPPVVEAKVDPGGKFGFVQFRDSAMCEVALHLFNGVALCGQLMTVARPAGTPTSPRHPAPPKPHACGARARLSPPDCAGAFTCQAMGRRGAPQGRRGAPQERRGAPQTV